MRRLLARFASAVLVLASVHAAAQNLATPNALALFDEVAYHLTFGYDGSARVQPGALLPDARAALAAHCAEVACAAADAVIALEAVIAAMADPHTRLLSVEEFAALRRAAAGAVGDGLGVTVHAPRDGLGLVVTDVQPGSPAARAGLARGDRVLRVDGAYLPNAPAARAAVWAAAIADGRVDVEALRVAAAPLVVGVVAAPVTSARPPELRWLPGDVAWLRVPTLMPARRVAVAVHALLRQARTAGAIGVLLDLRDDAGGAYCECLAVAGAFVAGAERALLGRAVVTGIAYADGVITYLDPLSGDTVTEAVPGATFWDGATAVLVNGRTASCAEATALDLQRLAGIPVVGEATAGMANVAVALVPLSNGMGLALSVARAYDESGGLTAAYVEPDLAVRDDLMALAAGEDRVLEAAWALVVGAR